MEWSSKYCRENCSTIVENNLRLIIPIDLGVGFIIHIQGSVVFLD
jgi:hypothetical protein